MDVTQAMATRRAYRSLVPAEISDDLIHDLARHAGLAPSCNNNQPWRFIFVRGAEALTALHEALNPTNAWMKAASALIAVCRFCKERGYSYLSDITAVDTGSEMRVVYRLVSLQSGDHLVISVGVPRTGGLLPTLTSVFRGANWPEREVYDLFGVRFQGHPDLRRILLTDDWQGYPMLKSGPAQGK